MSCPQESHLFSQGGLCMAPTWALWLEAAALGLREPLQGPGQEAEQGRVGDLVHGGSAACGGVPGREEVAVVLGLPHSSEVLPRLAPPSLCSSEQEHRAGPAQPPPPT